MLQVHHHCPGCAEENVSLSLRHILDSLGELLFTHHATSLTVSLAEAIIAVVALFESHIELLFAQIVVGQSRRFCHHHFMIDVFHHHTSARSVGNGVMVGRADVRVLVNALKQF